MQSPARSRSKAAPQHATQVHARGRRSNRASRGLKASDIDLGTVAKSAVVDRDVADAAFKLKAGEVSAPVQGRFGIAIVKVESIEPAKTRSFEEIAPELKRDLALERAKNDITTVEEKVEDERLGGATLADAARKFKLNPRTIEAIDRSGKDKDGKEVPGLPQGVDVLQAAFAADVHGDNEPLRLPNRAGYVWYDVDAITPAHERTLDEVKDKVVARWRDDEIALRLKTKATGLLDKIRGGASFADVAAAEKLKVETKPGIKRGTPPEGLSEAAVAEIFRTQKDAAGASENTRPTEWVLFRVTDIKVPPLDPQAADTKRLHDALKARLTEDLIAQYITTLQNEVGVSVNENALSQVSGGVQQ